MKVLFGSIFCALLTGVCCISFAQTKPSVVQGKVLMDTGGPADAATIVLMQTADSAIINSTLADKTGSYLLVNIKPGSYLLLITQIGSSKTYAGPFNLVAGQTFTAPNVILKQISTQLKDVTVVARKPYIQVKPGKVILNVQNSILADGNSAYEVLRQSPGVHVGGDRETLVITGRQPALITIDGKATNLTGDDLNSMLRSMQSSTIDQIEIISSGSAKYDASGGGIINIVLKKGKNIGTNGTVTAGAGIGKYAKGRAGIIFNSRTNKLNIFGNYTFDDNKTYRNIVNNRAIKYNDTLSNYDVVYNNIQKTQNHNFKAGADYSLSSKQTIGFLASGIIRHDDFLKDNTLNISNQNKLDSVIIARSTLGRSSSFMNYNINYNATLDKAGKSIAADVNYSTYNRHSNEYITNNFYTPLGNTYRDAQQLENLSPSEIHVWTSKIDYINPLGKDSRFETGLKYNHAQSDNNLIFGPKENNTYRMDPNFSNRFLYKEIVSSGYVNYYNKTGKWDITAGLRAENTKSTGTTISQQDASGEPSTKNYFNLFPQAQLSYSYTEKNLFTLSYNRGINRPTYQDINPFLYYTDPYDYRSGNKDLKPEYTNALQLSHTYNETYITTVYYNQTNNAYDFPIYRQNDTTKVNITERKNFGQIYIVGISFYVPVQITRWWSANFNLDVAHLRYKAYPVNGNYDKASQYITFNSTQNFAISSTISAELSGQYESPTVYGVSQLKQLHWINAGISKQVFNKRGSIKLNVNDIFNTQRDRYSSVYQNINLYGVDKKETRVIRLGFSYRFGKSTVKSAAKHDTGSADEQRRTNGN
jgi:outer membrane receptor protein involved in Fe transport